jgi:plasmid stabilization system protein ParE
VKGFILTPRAEQDVGDIWEYIALDSIEAADRVLTALEETMHRLAKNPGIGHMREELADRAAPLLLGLLLLDRLPVRNRPIAGDSCAACRPATCKAFWA